MRVAVSLPSGRTVQLSATRRVAELKAAAEKAFGQSFLRLLTANGISLNPQTLLADTGLRDGDTLSAVSCPPRVAAAGKAFAMWCPNGGCIAWGDPVAGGDCSSVAEQLWPVKEVQGSYAGFAALRSDGRVTCWGDVGVETELPSTLRDIQQLQSTNFAYATLDRQGRVYCWGDSDCGGDAGHLALENVATLASAGGAFAAICHDGSVLTWGLEDGGGDSSHVSHQLVKVQHIWGSLGAFAALRSDGQLVTWGDQQHGGDSSHVQEALRCPAASLNERCLERFGDGPVGGPFGLPFVQGIRTRSNLGLICFSRIL
ncbi:unnamed protein product [Durusdinium trenchii]|uniref:Ubiquitin-like domain-containing protein n=1 Tax=Durusdinium trenchii TaxID=1381693 RepID=A0ABP0JVV4_9DINO